MMLEDVTNKTYQLNLVQQTGQHQANGRVSRLQRQNFVKFNNAAVILQKMLRGRIVRKRLSVDVKIYNFFKKVQKVALVRQLLHGMKDSFMNLKLTKQFILKNYIIHCVTKIQKVWRGHFVRAVVKPVHVKLGKFWRLLAAVAVGWRVRRIFRTKEVRMRIQ